MNTKKKFLDILSYKISVLFFKLFGDDGYNFVSKSFNKRKTTKSISELKKDIKILDAKGFGKIHRFLVGEEGLSENLEPKEIENNNVYYSLLSLRTKTPNNLNYFLENQRNLIKALEEHKYLKKLNKRQKINTEANKQ